jgi:hypothetical protein
VLDYSSTGEKTAEHHLDAAGHPCADLDGVTSRRWAYSRDLESNLISEELCFDSSGREIPSPLGCKVIRRTLGAEGRMVRVQFLDPAGNPQAVVWLEVPNVAEARYVVLTGIGDVECAALFDVGGKVIARKQLNGHDSLLTRTEDVNYGY